MRTYYPLCLIMDLSQHKRWCHRHRWSSPRVTVPLCPHMRPHYPQSIRNPHSYTTDTDRRQRECLTIDRPQHIRNHHYWLPSLPVIVPLCPHIKSYYPLHNRNRPMKPQKRFDIALSQQQRWRHRHKWSPSPVIVPVSVPTWDHIVYHRSIIVNYIRQIPTGVISNASSSTCRNSSDDVIDIKWPRNKLSCPFAL